MAGSVYGVLARFTGSRKLREFQCVRAVEESRPETSYPFINEVRPGEMLVGFNHVLKSWHGVQIGRMYPSRGKKSFASRWSADPHFREQLAVIGRVELGQAFRARVEVAPLDVRFYVFQPG